MAAGQVTPRQIAQMAKSYGLDPQAVLAVARQEGLGGGIGDGGHAYGPFQLNNAGGVISSLYGGRVNDPGVQQWAWSTPGIQYALSRIAGVAKGLHGSQAINAIVSRFERPANPGKEIAGALSAYGSAPPAAGVQPLPFKPGEQSLNAQPLPAAGPNQNIAAALKLLGFAAPPAPRQPQPQPRVNLDTNVHGPVADQPQTPPPAFHGGTGKVEGATGGENARFLSALSALAAYEHAPVEINSGYRSYQKQAQLYANRASNPNPVAPPGRSLHEKGLAADGTVNGIPLGRIPAAILARFGLRPVPNDPVHVEWAGA
jgi:hypothetical protein